MFSGLKLEKLLFKEVLIMNFIVVNVDLVVNIDDKQLIILKSLFVGISFNFQLIYIFYF